MKKAMRILQLVALIPLALLGTVLFVLNVRAVSSGDFLAYSKPVFGALQHLLRAACYFASPVTLALTIVSWKKPRFFVASLIFSCFVMAFGISLAVISFVGLGSEPLYYIIPCLALPSLNLLFLCLGLFSKKVA